MLASVGAPFAAITQINTAFWLIKVSLFMLRIKSLGKNAAQSLLQAKALGKMLRKAFCKQKPWEKLKLLRNLKAFFASQKSLGKTVPSAQALFSLREKASGEPFLNQRKAKAFQGLANLLGSQGKKSLGKRNENCLQQALGKRAMLLRCKKNL